MIFRLYRNNDELSSTHAETMTEALWNFIIKDALPDEVFEEMKLETGGLTAVMPEGDVWQIRSLLGNILGLI